MLPDRLWITARDGIRLAADLYLPADVAEGERVPAILEALPYRKDDITASSHADDYERLSQEGRFAVCRLDVRGTGSSHGRATDEYPPVERHDLADVIAWLTTQPWSNGRAGVYGYSYSGFNALQIACERTPGLDAICAVYATDDRYTDDVHYMGGSLRAIDLVDYCHYMTASNALPPVPALFGDRWLDEWKARIDEHEPWLLRWLEEQHDGSYWRHGSLRPGYDRIECPTMIVAGWADGYRNNTFRTFAALQCDKALLIGPWSHASPATSLPGPHIDLVPEMIRWFDRWLRDTDNGVDTQPPIRVFMRHSTRPQPDLAMMEGEWRSDATWPPADARTQILRWTLDGEPDVDVLAVRADVGTAAWITCAGGLPWGQSLDQREDDTWSLTYDCAIDEGPLPILGHPVLTVRVAADQPVASLSVKLCDVFPDGTSSLITRGFLNLTHRHSSTSPTLLQPGVFEEVVVELEATAWVIANGHELRLSINGVDWPNTWVPPKAFQLSVERDSLHLQLPLADGFGEGAPQFNPPRQRPPVESTAEAGDPASHSHWRVERDILRRETVARTSYGGRDRGRDGCVVDQLYDGEVGVSLADPGRSWAAATTRYHLCWPEASCLVEARLRVDSDADAFDVDIELDATHDGEPLAHRHWQRRIPRRLL